MSGKSGELTSPSYSFAKCIITEFKIHYRGYRRAARTPQDGRLLVRTTSTLRRWTAFVRAVLVRRTPYGGNTFIRFALDPLAECLAAYEFAVRCGEDPEKWKELLRDALKDREGTRGFMLALQMNHAAYREAYRFPPVAFPER